MDDFAARMKSNSEMISKVHDNLASAEGQIAELGPKFESLAEDVSGQEKNAGAIASQTQSLAELGEKTRAQVDALRETTVSISRTSEALAAKVSSFAVIRKK